MQKLYISIFILMPFLLVSQTFQGKVYDNETTIAGVKIINKTQNILTYTNEVGSFSIEASINDHIVLTSLFHIEKSVVLTRKDFNDIIVFELKKAMNDLDEVLIIKEVDAKPFDAVEANTTLKNQILEDIKRNPGLYGKNPGGNFDIIAVAKLIGTLFKSKQPKEPTIIFADYNDLVKLFETDSYFNDQFLKNELKIQEDYKYLFFQYCEAKDIESKLLKVENRFLLLDVLLNNSKEFLEIINSDQKD